MFLNPTRPRSGSRALWGLFALGFACCFASAASATSLIMEGTGDLVEKSNSVVTGTITHVEAKMHDDHQFIYTYVTVSLDEVLKGDRPQLGQEIVLEELGGQVGPWIHHVSAVPMYEVGERVLAFLEDRPDNLYRTYGMIQGKFRFEIDARNGQEILTRPDEWVDTYLAANSNASELSVMRADGNFAASNLIEAIRTWVTLH